MANSAGGTLAGNEENHIIFCRGVLSLCGTGVNIVASAFLGDVDQAWQDNRRKRDGDHFHMTLLTKADLQRVCDCFRNNSDENDLSLELKTLGVQPNPDDAGSVAQCIAVLLASRHGGLTSWVALGRGKAKDDFNESSFIAVLWPNYASLRKALGLDMHDLHITLGFLGQDVHGKPKGVSSLLDGVPTADSIPALLAAATHLFEAGHGSDIDSDGIEQLVETALLGADSYGDKASEAASLRILCKLHGRMKQGERLLSAAERLLELYSSDDAGTRNLAYALLMLKRYHEALPILEQAHAQLPRLSEDMRATEEKRLEQALNFCKKKCAGSSNQTCEIVGTTSSASQRAVGGTLLTEATEAEDGIAPAAKDNYPKTPHLPFSPGVNEDDTRISDCLALLAEEVIVTEKLDGGNCCIKNGQVFGRTHSQPATHDSFSAVKQLAYNFPGELEGLELFGENMQGIHSIEYGNLSSMFYLFAVRRSGSWLSWDEVVALAEQIDIPTVPVVFRGRFASEKQLQGCLETWMKEPSAVGASVNPEGFVVRRSAEFRASDFSDRIAKYVRANHLQTGDAWKRTWKKARFGTELPKKPLRSLGEPLRNKLGNPRDRHKITTPGIGEVELPRNFSFILDDVAISSTPKRIDQILAMDSMGISLVVTLTEETPLPSEWFANTGVTNTFVPVTNYHPPTAQQTDVILQDIARVVGSGKRAMVHCGGGKGRAGTVAACLLLRYGLTSVQSGLEMERDEGLSVSCQMQSDEVLTLLRDLRPGSVETERQERFIREYSSLLWSRKAEAPNASELVRTISWARSEHEEEELIISDIFSSEKNETSGFEGASSSTALTKKEIKESKQLEKVKKDMAKRAPKYIFMVGLPGSGKSTFSCALEKSGNWTRANQDDLGRKGCEKKCAEVVPQVRQGRTRLVLDRCNTTKKEREEWIDILGNPSSKEILCVFFDTPSDTCKKRAADRLDHPTIRAGGGARIIDDMAKRFERPSASEGFSAVETIKSVDDAVAFLQRIGVDPSPILAVAKSGADQIVTIAEAVEVDNASVIEIDENLDENPIPESFRNWLQSSLQEEIDAADAEGLGAAVEVILRDPSAIPDAVEILAEGGAPNTATNLEQEWQNALSASFVPPSRASR